MKTYPIYQVSVRWSQDITNKDRDLPDWMTEGLPKGKMLNSISWYEMPQRDVSFDALILEAKMDWWPTFKIKCAEKIKNTSDLKITVKFQRYETWCPNWFSHWTWDTGLEDNEILKSFQDYVYRTQDLNRKEGKMKNGYFQEPYCLMGAEDYYRWKSQEEGGQPPCRCSACKKRGIISIDH